MKKLFSRSIILLVVGAMTTLTALAATSSRQVTFSRDVTVNGASVKAGTYKAKFDDQTGEFQLLRGKKVVAHATARLEKVNGTYRGAYSLTSEGETRALISINMNSTSQAVIINDSMDMKAVTP